MIIFYYVNVKKCLIFDAITSLKDSFKQEPLVIKMDDASIKDVIKNYNAMGLGAEAFAEQTGLSDESLKSYFNTVQSGNATFSGYTAYVNTAGTATGLMGVKSQIAAIGVVPQSGFYS